MVLPAPGRAARAGPTGTLTSDSADSRPGETTSCIRPVSERFCHTSKTPGKEQDKDARSGLG